VKHYGPKFLLAAALTLTLGLKLLDHNYRGSAPAGPATEEVLVSFLLQHGFESRLEEKSDRILVHVNAGKCRFLITEVAPQGWDRSSLEVLASRVGRLSYVFDGAVHEHEPFLVPMIDSYWTLVRIKLGLSPNYHPVLAVVASDDCSINALPWRELGTYDDMLAGFNAPLS
jgi:hypothetical protein